MSLSGHTNGRSHEVIGDDVRRLLEARRERLDARLASRAEEATLMVAEFRIGEDQYAIPLADFRAAMPLKLVTPVPLSPPEVVGELPGLRLREMEPPFR